MKRILYAKIVIAFGYILFGIYAGADQLNMAEVKEVPSMEQVSYMESDKAKRNSFVTVSIAPSCSFSIDPLSSDCVFDLDFSINYGVVFGKSALTDAGILEGNITGEGSYSSHAWHLVVGGEIDINFIKNNGVNNLIPGLFLGAGIGYSNVKVNNDKSGRTIGSVVVGAKLKAFVSKQLAIVPYLGAQYSQGHIAMINNKLVNLSSNHITVSMGLGLRYYF